MVEAEKPQPRSLGLWPRFGLAVEDKPRRLLPGRGRRSFGAENVHTARLSCMSGSMRTGSSQPHLSGSAPVTMPKNICWIARGDRSHAAFADDDAVHGTHRADLHRRAGEEDLVGLVEQVARDRRLAHGYAEVGGDGADAVAGDALQDAVAEPGRDQFVADDEKMFWPLPSVTWPIWSSMMPSAKPLSLASARTICASA